MNMNNNHCPPGCEPVKTRRCPNGYHKTKSGVCVQKGTPKKARTQKKRASPKGSPSQPVSPGNKIKMEELVRISEELKKNDPDIKIQKEALKYLMYVMNSQNIKHLREEIGDLDFVEEEYDDLGLLRAFSKEALKTAIFLAKKHKKKVVSVKFARMAMEGDNSPKLIHK